MFTHCYSQMQFKKLDSYYYTDNWYSVSQDTYIGTCVGVERKHLLITAPRLLTGDRGMCTCWFWGFLVFVLGFFFVPLETFSLIWRRCHYRWRTPGLFLADRGNVYLPIWFFFVMVWVFFRPIREIFSHMESSSLPLKGCKFWPKLATKDHWALKVPERASSSETTIVNGCPYSQ